MPEPMTLDTYKLTSTEEPSGTPCAVDEGGF